MNPVSNLDVDLRYLIACGVSDVTRNAGNNFASDPENFLVSFRRDVQELNTVSAPTTFVLELGPHFYANGLAAGDQIRLSTFKNSLTAVLKTILTNVDMKSFKMIFFGTSVNQVLLQKVDVYKETENACESGKLNKLGMTLVSTFGVPTFDSYSFTERAPKKHAEDAIHWDHYGPLLVAYTTFHSVTITTFTAFILALVKNSLGF